MSRAYRRALESLSAIRQRLANIRLTDAERVEALSEFDAVLRTLTTSEHKTSTTEMAARVSTLDHQLRDRTARERNSIVTQRLGISRSRLYELRRVHNRPDGGAV